MIESHHNLPAARRANNVLRKPPRQWFVDYLPVTGGNNVELLVNGKNYGESLYAALQGCSSEVMLTGLHFQPTWRLVREAGGPVDKADPMTLLNVLTALAKKGVTIHLIVNQFWANEWTTGNPISKAIKKAGNLQWYLPETSELFLGLSQFPNVHCRTDVHQGAWMGTHHQKTVIIDKKVAFVGGIDLTLVDGDRWDDADHIMPPAAPVGEDDLYGPDDKRRYGLPEHFWHDVHCKVEGPAVEFVLDNFHARWNHGIMFKDVWWRTKEKVKYVRRGFRAGGGSRHGGRKRVKYTERVIEGISEPEEDRAMFPRIEVPPQVYQDRMRDESSLHHREADKTAPEVVGSCGLDSVPALDGTKIQVVRSMPAGAFEDHQRPHWNLSGEGWERSAKDAYLIGIRAARDYVYLENQWVSDEHIWAELKASMRRNRDNPKFRMVIVLPRRPLAAAGAGTDQDFSMKPHIKGIIKECKFADQFGMYCIEAKVPESRQDDVGLSELDLEEHGKDTAQIYVHSKVLVVDDTWGLIGSANAGGISLLGVPYMRKMFTTGIGSLPDSELSVIIHDPAFGANFRKSLWAEHLEQASCPGDVALAADLMRDAAAKPGSRLRPAVVFSEAMKKGYDGLRRVPKFVVESVGENSEIASSEPGPLPLSGGLDMTFTINALSPGLVYENHYRWTLVTADGRKYDLHHVVGDHNAKNYRKERTVYLTESVGAKIRKRVKGVGKATLQCRIVVTSKGVRPEGNSAETKNYSTLVELPIMVDGS